MKILVIGESCLDVFQYGECKRLCPESPVPVFNSLNVVKNGGMAKNVENNLESLNIETNLITNPNWENITKTRFIELNSNHMFLRVDKNDTKYSTLSLEKIESINFKEYSAVIVSDYNKKFLSEEILYKISTSHPLTFLDTKKILGKWCEEFTFIKINNKEYEATQHTLNEKILSKLIRTKGPLGSIFQDTLYSVKSVEIKDTSGAGDTFISGLAFKYVETKDIYQSIAFANECATKVVQKRGVNTI